MTTPLDILWDAHGLVAIAKPSGVPTHRPAVGRDEPSCMQRLRNQLGAWVYPVHRLDRATSGVLLFARDQELARAMSAAFARREVEKVYLAVVRGHLEGEGEITRALKDQKTGEPKAAETHYRALAQTERPWPVGRFTAARYALVELRPKTGRTHQLRRHLAGIAHPILGDTVYGDGAHNKLMGERLGLRRLMLHARRLVFTHPESGERIGIEAACEPSFDAVLAALGLGGVREESPSADPGQPSPCGTESPPW